MPPPPPDRPVGAAAPSRPLDGMASLCPLAGFTGTAPRIRRSAAVSLAAPLAGTQGLPSSQSGLPETTTGPSAAAKARALRTALSSTTTGMAEAALPFALDTPNPLSAPRPTTTPRGGAVAINPSRLLSVAAPRPGTAPPGTGPTAPVFDPVAVPPDPALIARYGARLCLRHGLLPWQCRDGDTLILTATPAAFETHRPALAAAFGAAIRPLPCPRQRIEAALLTHAAGALTHDAEHALPAHHSARSLNHARIATLSAALLIAIVAGLILAAVPTLTLLTALGLVCLFALFLLKSTACLATLRHRPAPPPPPLPDDLLPVISVLIPLYGEAEIATRLLKRLSRIDYPTDRLDILILTEEDDTPTRVTLAAAPLPDGVRVLAVPRGRVRTKPRALNFGMDFCRGRIIGIWDAEDAPAPDQLRKVAAAFADAPADLVCLQGALDFYNPDRNWIARCFTMDYALWFRLFLPGLERLGLPMPLGGTTLFLRRSAIEAAGGWDAHNVTEDADLGLRLARMGLRTAMLDSTTMEEANCRIRPWIKQRSRWSKGYLMTWFVHMRAPLALMRDLGLRQFLAVQALLLGSLVHGVTAPLVLLLWLHSLPFTKTDWLPVQLPMGLALLLVASRLIDFAFIHAAMRRAGHASPGWRLLWLKPYDVLATIATIKAVGEAPLRPFHWDKTHHGDFHDAEDAAADGPDDRTGNSPQIPQHAGHDRRRAIAGTAAPISASLSRPLPPATASRRPC